MKKRFIVIAILLIFPIMVGCSQIAKFDVKSDKELYAAIKSVAT